MFQFPQSTESVHLTVSRGTPSNDPKVQESLRGRIDLALGGLWLRAVVLRSHIVQSADELWPEEQKPPGFANACIRNLQPLFWVTFVYLASYSLGFVFLLSFQDKMAGLTDSLYAFDRFTDSAAAAWILYGGSGCWFLSAVYVVWLYTRRPEFDLKRFVDHASAFIALLFNSVFFLISPPEHIPVLAILLLAQACAIPVFFRQGLVHACTTVILAMAYTQGALIGALAGMRILYA
jgi:hypothetical protein